MSMSTNAFDVVVIGGGPAGMGTATRASSLGLRTALIEEGPATGGQVYRPLPSPFSAAGKEHPGDALRKQLRASEATVLLGHAVWNVSDGYRVDVIGARGTERIHTRALVLATGTYERFVPVKGWTLPGVIGLGAATVLMKSQYILPGRNVVVAGAGPLLLLVAAMILEGGGRVAALIDLNGVTDWTARLPAMLSRPDLIWQGSRWWSRLLRAGTPVFRQHTVTEIEGEDSVRAVQLAPVDASWRLAATTTRTIAADAVCIGHGLCPSTEMTRLLNVPHRFAPELGGWIPEVGDDFRSYKEGLYVVGDAAGVQGAEAAPLSGEIAALSAAHALDRLDHHQHVRARTPLLKALRRASRFGRAMSGLTRIRAGLVADISPDTIVCRCEDVTRRQIDDAVVAGCRDINQVKAVTRCGMGPCQGRMCGDAATSIMALTVGSREHVGQLTARPPFRPIATKALTGSFDYDDIVMAEHSPT